MTKLEMIYQEEAVERKLANPVKDMVSSTQKYQAYAVRIEPITNIQAMNSENHDFWGRTVNVVMLVSHLRHSFR